MDRVVAISGASRGIGLATAERFLQEGYRVVSLSRSRPANPEIEHLQVDFSVAHWVEGLADLDSWMAADTQLSLIHNASVLRKDSVRNAGAALAGVLQINLVAAQELNEYLLPRMTRGSCILYLGSTLSDKAVANTLSYSVSKHAILGLMRATCQDLVGTGIHTAAVCPGFTDTEMLRNHLGNDPQIIGAIEQGVSYGRLIRPEEIAEALWFCAKNPVINGSVIHANLGQIES